MYIHIVVVFLKCLSYVEDEKRQKQGKKTESEAALQSNGVSLRVREPLSGKFLTCLAQSCCLCTLVHGLLDLLHRSGN